MLIVDALNKPEVLAFYRKNGFETLFTTEQQEDVSDAYIQSLVPQIEK